MIYIGYVSGAMLALYWLRYLIFKRKEQPFALPVLFTCLFLPKLKLVEISDLTTAGIRPDDFLALLLLLIAIMDPDTYRNKHVKRGILLLIALSVLNLGSVLVGRMNGYNNNILLSILMVVRKFEYGSFALTGIYLLKRLKNPYKTFMDEFTLMSVMHVLLAALQVCGKLTYIVSGYDEYNFFDRIAVSTFNGYYEYGQFLCFGCAVFLCDYLRNKSWRSLAMVPVSVVMLYFSKSRSSLVIGILLLGLIVYLPVRGKISRRKLALGAFGMIGVAMAGTVLLTGIVGGKTVGRFGTLKIEEYLIYWKSIVKRGYFDEYVKYLKELVWELDIIGFQGYLDKITDWSMAIRFYKWGAVLDGLRHYPVLGYGTGVTHVMDGNYLKLLAETGIFGTALWLFFYGYYMRAVYKLRKVSQLAKPVLLIMISILLNSVLIDMFEASKPMEMLWLMIGAVIAYEGQKQSQRSKAFQCVKPLSPASAES